MNCPRCGAEDANTFIAVDGGFYGIFDGIIAWLCPACRCYWNRFNKTDGRRYERTEELIAQWNKEKTQ